MGMQKWIDLRLTGVGAMIFAVLWVLTNYSIRTSSPFLTRLAGVVAITLAIVTVIDALRGGLTD